MYDLPRVVLPQPDLQHIYRVGHLADLTKLISYHILSSTAMRRSQSYFSSLLLVLSVTGLTSAIEMDAAAFAKQDFDFIVCGGGTAGTAVAVRYTIIHT